MRKVAKKLREAAEDLAENKVVVRREDRALRPFIIPFQTAKEGESSAGSKLMKMSSISLPAYINGGRVLDLGPLPVLIEKNTRIRIKGPNGIGKSTFLESIVQRNASGIKINPRARIGYYRQDFHNLNFDMTVLDCLYQASNDKHTEYQIRSIAAALLLRGDEMNQTIRTLSEGQKGLLSFACLVLQEPAILIVDEPTNHINFRHLPALAAALNSFEGALLVVSHDADFVSQLKIDREIDLGDLS
jgi:ATPase subunit of ABC transporter with duplicated ATPase domains